MRVQYPDLFAELLAHDFYRFQQVRIVRHHHGDIEPAHVSIVQQVCRKVHVRAFFLGLQDAHILPTLAGSHDERHRHLVAQEMAEMYRHAWQGLKRA